MASKAYYMLRISDTKRQDRMHTNFALRTCVDLRVLSNGSLKTRSKDRRVAARKIAANKEDKRMPSSKQGVESKTLSREIGPQPSISRQTVSGIEQDV